jgi:hypothetical protein
MPGAKPQHGKEGEDEKHGDGHAGEGSGAAHGEHEAWHEEPAADEDGQDDGRGDRRAIAFALIAQSENPPSGEMMMPVVKSLSSPAR